MQKQRSIKCYTIRPDSKRPTTTTPDIHEPNQPQNSTLDNTSKLKPRDSIKGKGRGKVNPNRREPANIKPRKVGPDDNRSRSNSILKYFCASTKATIASDQY